MDISPTIVIKLWLTLLTYCSTLKVTAGHPLEGDQKAHRHARDVNHVELETELGTVVGYKENVIGKELDIFLGVPYAEPPVGENRFQRPKMVQKWEEAKYATKQPSSCSQTIDTSFNQFPGVQMWNPNTNMSEDCLYLNIWAPSARLYGKSKAVMVWIFGGSFTLGSSTLDIYDGRILAAQGDVVVVSMQYRIGPMGFLYLGVPGAQGNMGLLDQQLALRWVFDYIEAFGGDQNRITVFGESAGAASTGFHLLSPKSQPYFKSSIMQSGSALCPWAVASNDTALQRSLHLAEKVGCSRTASKEDILVCLKKVPAQKLSDKIWEIPGELQDIIAPISPIVDGYFLPEHPREIIKKGEAKNTNIMLGMNKDEGYYFLVYSFEKLFNLSDPHRKMSKEEYRTTIANFLHGFPDSVVDAIAFEYGAAVKWDEKPRLKDVMDDLLGDYSFKCPVIDFARMYADQGKAVYLYNFVHRTSANPWPEWLGTMHGYEIDHVFGAPLNISGSYNDQEKTLSRQMVQYWSNFAKTQNPNLDARNEATDVTWPVYTLKEQHHMVLNTTPVAAVSSGLRHRPCTLWRDIVPKLKQDIDSTCGACSIRLNISTLSLILCLLYVAQRAFITS